MFWDIIMIEKVKAYTEEFSDFLIKTNVVHLIIAFIVGSYVTKMSSNVTEILITPLISKITGSNIKNVQTVEIKVFGVSLKIGKLIYTLFEFLLTMIIIFILFTKLIQIPAKVM